MRRQNYNILSFLQNRSNHLRVELRVYHQIRLIISRLEQIISEFKGVESEGTTFCSITPAPRLRGNQTPNQLLHGAISDAP